MCRSPHSGPARVRALDAVRPGRRWIRAPSRPARAGQRSGPVGVEPVVAQALGHQVKASTFGRIVDRREYLSSDLNHRTELAMFTLGDSLDVVKAFAGEDCETASSTRRTSAS